MFPVQCWLCCGFGLVWISVFDLLLVVNLNCRLVLIAVVCVRCLDLCLLWLLYRLYVLGFVGARVLLW